jgi:K+-transporting ATPase ATPase C chain
MQHHLRANLWLLLFTLLLCSVLYPAVLLVVGQTVFHDQAQGSLLKDAKGKVIGSRLIAQPFTGDEYFQPRPSAASFKADASGGTNWGANNYLLRDRVARQLGPIVKYGKGAEKHGKKEGEPVQPDIEAWFRADHYEGKPGIVAQWAHAHPGLAQAWVKGDKLNGEYVARWQKVHADLVRQWIKDNPNTPEPKLEDLAVPFFVNYSEARPGTWPGVVERKTPRGQPEKVVVPVKENSTDIQSIFFDMWRNAHPDAVLEEVPADMVMASGSGLDPHITLANARYQLKHRVATAQAQKLAKAKVDQMVKTRENGKPSIDETERGRLEDQVSNKLGGKVREAIGALLEKHKVAPLSGLVGVEMVNVLELNLDVAVEMDRLAKPSR